MVATYATFTPDDQPFQSSGVANHFTASAIGAVQSTPVYELEYAEISSTAQGLSTVLPSQINTIANQGQFQQGLCTFDVQDWSFGATPHISEFIDNNLSFFASPDFTSFLFTQFKPLLSLSTSLTFQVQSLEPTLTSTE